MTSQKNKLSTEKKKLFNKVFWRSFTLSGTWNYINAQGVAFLYCMLPFINAVYKKKEDRVAAMKRHMSYFNITVPLVTFPLGIAGSMEEENATKSDFDISSINAIKASLMGPLSGIGDSFFWGTFRVIAAGIGISLAQEGNPLGPVLFLVLYNIPHLLTRYYGLKLGYNLGGQFIKKAYENGLIAIITRAAGILGLMMVGAMIYSNVSFTTSLQFDMGSMTFKLQEILDQIMKGILPLGATMGYFALLRKKVSANKIIIGILIISLIFSLLKIA